MASIFYDYTLKVLRFIPLFRAQCFHTVLCSQGAKSLALEVISSSWPNVNRKGVDFRADTQQSSSCISACFQQGEDTSHLLSGMLEVDGTCDH